MSQKISIRPNTVQAIRKGLQIFFENGIVTMEEYNLIVTELSYLAKHGENKPAILPKLVTPQEAAEMLAISYSQFRTLEKEKAFPFKRRTIGNKTVRYLNTDIINFILEGSVEK